MRRVGLIALCICLSFPLASAQTGVKIIGQDGVHYCSPSNPFPVTGGGSGTVTAVTGVAGQTTSTGGTTPAIGLATTGVVPGTYTLLTGTVDAYGRLTAASNGVSGSSTNNAVLLTNSSALTVSICSPVYCSGNATFSFARANAGTTANVIGIAGASVPASTVGSIVVSGVITGTTAQWDAVVTGESGGLTPGARYYLDASTAGNLTITAPVTTGQYVESVGIALSTTQLLINPQPPILL